MAIEKQKITKPEVTETKSPSWDVARLGKEEATSPILLQPQQDLLQCYTGCSDCCDLDPEQDVVTASYLILEALPYNHH